MAVTTRHLKTLILTFFRVKMEWREMFKWKRNILLFSLKLLVKVILTNLLISEENNMNGLNTTDKETTRKKAAYVLFYRRFH